MFFPVLPSPLQGGWGGTGKNNALQSHKSVYANAGGHIVNGNQTQTSMISLDSQGIKNTTFGNTYDKYKNVYHHEVSRDFQNREGPGPGTI